MLVKREYSLAVIVFLLSFLAYFLTLCPTVFTGDSGELIVNAYTLGVPHSPGYPLYCLLGKLFTFIPWGSIAFRVNLMSAFFASLSAVVIYFIIFRLISQIKPDALLIDRLLPAVSASLAYAYSDTFWSQAVVAEVYTLWIFVLSLAFLVLIIWTEKKADNLLYLFSFLYGVAVTCHQLSLFFAPGFLLLIFSYQPKIILRWKTLFLMFDFFLIGLCLYLYIPIRAATNPPINWNKIHDVNRFIGYLLREQYGSVKQNFDPSYVTQAFRFDFNKVKQLLGFLKFEFSPICIYFLFAFIPLFLRAKRYLLATLMLCIFALLRIWRNVPLEQHSLYVGRVYLLAGYIIIALWIGLGTFYLLDFYSRKKKKAFYYLLILLICIMPAIPLAGHYFHNDQSRNYIDYDFGKNILDTLEKNAILLGRGDNALFSLAYLQYAEKMRPDVTIYDDIGGDVFKDTPFVLTDMPAQKRDLLIAMILKKNRPLYISFGHTIIATTKHPKELLGIVYKILRENEKIPPKLKEKYWKDYQIRDVFGGDLENKDYLMREIIATYHIALGTFLMGQNSAAGLKLYSEAARIGGNAKFTWENLAMYYALKGMYDEAISASKKAVSIEPNNPEVLFNLGVTYGKAKKYNEAISAWKATLKLAPDFPNTKDYVEKAKKLMSDEAVTAKTNVH